MQFRIRPATSRLHPHAGRETVVAGQNYYIKLAQKVDLRHPEVQQQIHRLSAVCAGLCSEIRTRVQYSLLQHSNVWNGVRQGLVHIYPERKHVKLLFLHPKLPNFSCKNNDELMLQMQQNLWINGSNDKHNLRLVHLGDASLSVTTRYEVKLLVVSADNKINKKCLSLSFHVQ